MFMFFEIIFVTIDYLAILLEPLFDRLQLRFNPLHMHRHFGAINGKRVKRSMEGLEEEICEFYDTYKQPLGDIYVERSGESDIDNEKRSRLMFCLTQTYPQLPALHLLLQTLLQSANLIEPPLASSAGSQLDATQEPDRCHKSSDIESESGAESRESKGVKFCETNQLDRYSLALMIGAYLQLPDPFNKPKLTACKVNGGKCPLASHLIGFLMAFGEPLTSCDHRHIYIGPKLDQEAGALDFKVLEDQGGKGTTSDGFGSLTVLDPAVGKAEDGFGINNEAERKMITEHNLDDRLCGRVNLTRGLANSDKIGRLFQKLLDHLNNICSKDTERNADKHNAYESILASTFVLSSRASDDAVESGSAEAKNRNTTRASSELDELPIKQNHSAGYQILSSKKSRSVSKGQKLQRAGRVAIIGSKFGALNGRKVLKSILYLAIFLLIRSLLLNYLVSLRRELQDKVRDDLVQLKHSIFIGVGTEDPIYDEDYPSKKSGAISDDSLWTHTTGDQTIEQKQKSASGDEITSTASEQVKDSNDNLSAQQSAESGLDEADQSAGSQEPDFFAEIAKMLMTDSLGEQGEMNIEDLMAVLKKAQASMGDGNVDAGGFESLLGQLMGGQGSIFSGGDEDEDEEDEDGDGQGQDKGGHSVGGQRSGETQETADKLEGDLDGVRDEL